MCRVPVEIRWRARIRYVMEKPAAALRIRTVIPRFLSLLYREEENMRKREKHGPHMTGPNADAAASCGDDTLSQK